MRTVLLAALTLALGACADFDQAVERYDRTYGATPVLVRACLVRQDDVVRLRACRLPRHK